MADALFVIRRDVMELLRRSRSQIYEDIETKVASMRKPPTFLLPKDDIESACCFLAGYDSALHGVPLGGLYYWLVLKVDPDSDGIHWFQNLPRIARRKAGKSAPAERVLEEACRILARFFAYRRRYGTRKLVREYMSWHKQRIERARRHQEKVHA